MFCLDKMPAPSPGTGQLLVRGRLLKNLVHLCTTANMAYFETRCFVYHLIVLHGGVLLNVNKPL